jgi:Fungal protein kinase
LDGKEQPVAEESCDTGAQEGPPRKRARTNQQASKYKGECSDSGDANYSSGRDTASYSDGQLVSDSSEKHNSDVRKPDWILLDGDSDGQIPGTPLWRQIAIMLELKSHSSLVPDKQNPNSRLIVQCVDYARLHLALRPFQRFSIIFSLCGTVFTAWLVDRTGVVISDNVDIKQDSGLDTFIRAIAQVTSHLTMYELGMDPTVAIHRKGSMGDLLIPRFAITMPSHNVYVTRGIPIWQSASIFGRGTVVWTVEKQGASIELPNTSAQADGTLSMEVDADLPMRETPTFILKNAYRNEDRLGESNFYLTIKDVAVDGLAVFREGGDVEIPEKSEEEEGDSRSVGENHGEVNPSENSDSKSMSAKVNGSLPSFNDEVPTDDMGRYISSQLHRKGLTDSACKPNTIAHRLVLESKGRRLTEHASLVELLEAVLASIRGMCFLHLLRL